MIKFERVYSGTLPKGTYELDNRTSNFELAIVCQGKIIRYKKKYNDIWMTYGIWEGYKSNKRKTYKWEYDEK